MQLQFEELGSLSLSSFLTSTQHHYSSHISSFTLNIFLE